ncbi:MAG TPA: hypothetical protein VND68_11215 [Chloroflexia bacterium]|nr:hypothetical protein [Chloroflexia bacterium]
MRERIHKGWRFLVKNWHPILAAVATIGFLISSFIPHLGSLAEPFAFVGLVAILLILLEIRTILVEASHPMRYSDMRKAREHILRSIRDTAGNNHRRPLDIHIIGGRLHTISDMLRELVADIHAGHFVPKNVTITVYCMDPVFVKSWSSERIRDIKGFEDRNNTYSTMIKSSTHQILANNQSRVFQQNQVSFKIVYYNCFPTMYAFLVGKNALFWGSYTWDDDGEDFVGPNNPCYYHHRTSDYYEDYYDLILNRTEFLKLTSSARYSPSIMSDEGGRMVGS